MLKPNDIGLGIGFKGDDKCCSFWNLYDFSDIMQHYWQKSIVHIKEYDINYIPIITLQFSLIVLP